MRICWRVLVLSVKLFSIVLYIIFTQVNTLQNVTQLQILDVNLILEKEPQPLVMIRVGLLWAEIILGSENLICN